MFEKFAAMNDEELRTDLLARDPKEIARLAFGAEPMSFDVDDEGKVRPYPTLHHCPQCGDKKRPTIPTGRPTSTREALVRIAFGAEEVVLAEPEPEKPCSMCEYLATERETFRRITEMCRKIWNEQNSHLSIADEDYCGSVRAQTRPRR